MTTATTTTNKQSLFSAILVTWLIAGTADGLAACINFYINTGKGPAPVFKYIASAIFGKEAYTSGNTMIIWGILFHLLIAFIFTAFFFFLYPRLALFRKNKILVGIAYGIFVWLVMSQLVVPASRIPAGPFHWDKAIIAILILICCIGLPISLFANRYYEFKIQK